MPIVQPKTYQRLLVALFALVLLSGCVTSRHRPSGQGSIDCSPSSHPVVFVPGILGSRLVDSDTERVLWGSGLNVLLPRDHGYRLALPLGGNDYQVKQDGPIETVQLLFYKRQVYRRIVDLFESNGYRRGFPNAPSTQDDFFIFSYDWRRDNLETVADLADFLHRLKQARGNDRLRVSLVCQSNGAHICRYLLKYGNTTLADSAAGRGQRLSWLDVESVMLVGTANGGALRTLREIDRGRQYLSPVGRHMKPEAVFTFRSALQDLPVGGTDLFVDPSGRALDVDVFDVASWHRYGWSIFSGDSERRIERKNRADLFSDRATRGTYLAQALERSKTLHEVLARDIDDFPEVDYLLVENQSHDTAVRAVIDDTTSPPKLIFPTDRAARSLPPGVRQKLVAAGDGHATLDSQRWLSPQELAALGSRRVSVGGEHFEAIFEPETLDALIRFHGRSEDAERCGPGFQLPSTRPRLHERGIGTASTS